MSEDNKRLDELSNRVGRLEDRYQDLALKLENVSTKMNILAALGGITLSTALAVFIAVVFHL